MWELASGLSWSNSASYNSSTISSDYMTGTATGTRVIASKGKDAVDAPRVLANSALRYHDKRWTGNMSVRHVDKRYFTILNDLSVPGYTTVDAGASYRIPSARMARELLLQFNVANVFDTSYIGPIGTGGFTVSGDNQTLQAGARRLMFFTVGTTF